MIPFSSICGVRCLERRREQQFEPRSAEPGDRIPAHRASPAVAVGLAATPVLVVTLGDVRKLHVCVHAMAAIVAGGGGAPHGVNEMRVAPSDGQFKAVCIMSRAFSRANCGCIAQDQTLDVGGDVFRGRPSGCSPRLGWRTGTGSESQAPACPPAPGPRSVARSASLKTETGEDIVELRTTYTTVSTRRLTQGTEQTRKNTQKRVVACHRSHRTSRSRRDIGRKGRANKKEKKPKPSRTKRRGRGRGAVDRLGAEDAPGDLVSLARHRDVRGGTAACGKVALRRQRLRRCREVLGDHLLLPPGVAAVEQRREATAAAVRRGCHLQSGQGWGGRTANPWFGNEFQSTCSFYARHKTATPP